MFENYTVFVKIALKNEVTKGLTLLSGQFSSLNKDVDKLQRKLKDIKVLGLTGGALAATGFLGLNAISKAIKPASEYAHQIAQMNVAGMKHAEVIKAINASWAATKNVPTSNVTENLAAVRELRMVFGNTEEAITYMPIVQKIQSVLSSLKGGHSSEEAYTLAKSLEMRGAVKDPNQFVTQADLMTRAMIATGGKVNASDYLNAFKYGRSATSGWNDEFTYKILPTLIQEMKSAGGAGGGGGPGNALMSAYATVVGGTISQRSLKTWQKLGLLDPDKIVWNKVGSAKGVAPGGIKGTNEFIANPYEWAKNYLIPALKKHGFDTEEKQKQAMQYLFANRTAGFVMSQFVTQAWKFERDKKLIEQAQGLGSYNELLKNDPTLAAMALQKQWNSMLAILGYQLMPSLLKGMGLLMNSLRSFSNWLKDNPAKARGLVYAFTGLSAALAFSGSILLLTAAFKALTLSVTLLSTPMLTLATPIMGIVAVAGLAAVGLYNLLESIDAIYKKNKQEYQLASGAGGVTGLLQQKHLNIVPPTKAANQTIQVHSSVHLDGKKVGDAVTKHQVREATRVPNHSSRFDPSITPVPSGVLKMSTY